MNSLNNCRYDGTVLYVSRKWWIQFVFIVLNLKRLVVCASQIVLESYWEI